MLFGKDTKAQLNIVNRMLHKGIIKGKRLGGRWYITRAEIERITDEPANIPSDT